MELVWREEEPSNPNSLVLPPPEFRTFFPKKGERWDTPKISDDIPIVDEAALIEKLEEAVVPGYNWQYTLAAKLAKGTLHHLQYPARWYEDPDLLDDSLPEEQGRHIGMVFRESADRKLNLPVPMHGLLHEVFNPLGRPSRDLMYEFNLARFPQQRMVQIVKGSEAAARKHMSRTGGGYEESLHKHLGYHIDRFAALFETAQKAAPELVRVQVADLQLTGTHDMLRIRDRLSSIAVVRTPVPHIIVPDNHALAA